MADNTVPPPDATTVALRDAYHTAVQAISTQQIAVIAVQDKLIKMMDEHDVYIQDTETKLESGNTGPDFAVDWEKIKKQDKEVEVMNLKMELEKALLHRAKQLAEIAELELKGQMLQDEMFWLLMDKTERLVARLRRLNPIKQVVI